MQVMKTMKQTVWCALLLVLLMTVTDGASKADYYNLYDALFDSSDYKKEIRPARTGTSTMVLRMEFRVMSIIEVDEKQQTLVTSARPQMLWVDDFLSWDPLIYSDLNTLLVSQDTVYLPDIVVANSVMPQERLGYKELQVRIMYGGLIFWEPSILLYTSCDIDITYYPFDTQKCYVEVTTAVSQKTEIDVRVVGKVNLDEYTDNGQWELITTSSEDMDEPNEVKAKIRFGFLIKRRRTFYTLYVVLPIFFLSVVSSLVFALPIDAGEKIGMSITNLLTFAVYLSIVADMIPNTSLQISLLGLYLTILLGLSAFSVIACVFIIRLHFRDKESPVGPKTTKMNSFLRRLMCMGSNDVTTTNQVGPPGPRQGKDKNTAQDKDVTKQPIRMFVEPEAPLTWQDVASTLDLFCFLFFSLSTITITVTCLLALIVGGGVNTPSL